MAGYANRNHYLPQAYLWHFCDESGTVLRTFRGPDDALHERRFAPKATGYEHDLYTLEHASPLLPVQRPDLIETDVFGPIDRDGARVLERLIQLAPSQLSDDERGHLAIYLNSLLERHPQRLYERDLAAERVARERIEVLRREFGPPLPGRQDIFDLLDVSGLARNIHRQHMVNEIQKPTSIAYLRGLTLIKLALEPGSAISFVTGDNPVLVNGGQPWPLHFFTLALSPSVLLLGLNSDQIPELDLTEVKTIVGLCMIHNLQLLAQCEYIFSRESLDDNALVRSRTAALTSLKQVAWRRSR